MMPIYYCDQCLATRQLPKTELTKTAVQCSFCDKAICKCHQGTYEDIVGTDTNPDVFKTASETIWVTQPISLPKDLPMTKIHPRDKKLRLNDKMIIVFQPSMGEDKSCNLSIVNRHSGEQINVKM